MVLKVMLFLAFPFFTHHVPLFNFLFEEVYKTQERLYSRLAGISN